MTDDPIAGLHRRFDKLEDHFKIVETEQKVMAKNMLEVNHRVDMVEVQIQRSQ